MSTDFCTYNSESHVPSMTGTYLVEYFCTGSNYNYHLNERVYACDCFNNTCTNGQQGSCMDSDGGVNLGVLGTTVKGDISKVDLCVGTTKVNEFSCSGVDVINATYNCPGVTSCNGGKCAAQTNMLATR
jgi:hypothetical protein